MRRFLFIILLAAFASTRLCAQTRARSQADSLRKELAKAPDDTGKVMLLHQLAGVYYTRFDSTMRYAGQALALADKLHWVHGMVLSKTDMGNGYYLALQNAPKALACYLDALKMAEDNRDTKGQLAVLGQMVDLYNYNNDYTRALEYAERSLPLLAAGGNADDICEGLSGVAAVYENMHDFDKARTYLYTWQKIAGYRHNSKGAAGALQRIAATYQQQGNDAMALKQYAAAVSACQAAKDKYLVRENLRSIGKVYQMEHNAAMALHYFSEVMQIDSNANDKAALANDCFDLVNVYLGAHQYDSAIAQASRSLAIYNEADSANVPYALGILGQAYYLMASDSTTPASPAQKLQWLRTGCNYMVQAGIQPTLTLYTETGTSTRTDYYYDAVIDAEKRLGDYSAALRNLDSEKTIEEATTFGSGQQLMSSLDLKQATYEHDKQAALTKVEEENKAREKMFYIALLALLAVVVIIVYRNARMQRKANRQLQAANKTIKKEKDRSEELLLNILPAEVADELKEKGHTQARYFDNVSVIFTDFVDFTKAGERMQPQQLVDELDACFKEFDRIITKYGIEKIKTIGDAYLAASGLPAADAAHAEKAVQAAIEISNFMRERHAQLGDRTFTVRIGVHSGSLVAGIVGVKKFAYDIWGDTVNTAARMQQHSEPGRINVSAATYELVKDKFAFHYRGEIEAKNKGKMKMYFVE